MLVKLDHFPRDRGENKKCLKPPPSKHCGKLQTWATQSASPNWDFPGPGFVFNRYYCTDYRLLARGSPNLTGFQSWGKSNSGNFTHKTTVKLKNAKWACFLGASNSMPLVAPFISQEEIGSWSSFSLKSSGWRCRVCLGQPSEVTSPTFPVALKNRNRFWGFGRIGPDLTLLTWVPMDNRGTYGCFFKLGDIATILESTPRTGEAWCIPRHFIKLISKPCPPDCKRTFPPFRKKRKWKQSWKNRRMNFVLDLHKKPWLLFWGL